MSKDTIRLGDLCAIVMGQSPDSSSYNTSGHGMPFFQGNADFGKVSPTAKTWCTDPKKTASAGDLLISVRAPIGALNIADQECCIGRGLSAIRPDSHLASSRFLWHFLAHIRPQIEARGTGSTLKAINKSSLGDIPVPVYPLQEQEAIAEKLDTVSQVMADLSETRQQLDCLVKSKFVEMFGDPRSNIHGFAKKTLKDVAMGKLSYGSSCSAVPFDGNMRFIRITDINEEGRLNQDIKSPSIIDEKYLLHDGDILFARTGATVGKTYRYRTSDEKAIYAGYLIRAIPDKSQILPDYLFWFTKTRFYLRFVLNAQKTVAQPNINAQEYGKLELLVPPLSLQEEFARFAEQADKSQFTPVPSATPLQDCDAFLIGIPSTWQGIPTRQQ